MNPPDHVSPAQDSVAAAPACDGVVSAPRWFAPGRASLRVNFSWTLAGNVVYSGCQWLILMLLAKSGTREMVGEFAYALALTAPVIMLANLQLRAVQATDARDQFPFETYLGLRLTATGGALAVIALLTAFTGPRGVVSTVLAMALAKAIEAISDVLFGLLQRHERMDLIARSTIAKGLISVAGMFVAVRATGSVFWGTVTLCAGWATVLVCYDMPRTAEIWRRSGRSGRPRPRLDRASLWRLTRLALPLGIVMMLISLGANIPRYFIENRLGLRELGVFSAANYLLVAGLMVVGALGQSAAPRLAQLEVAGDRPSFLRLLLTLVAFAASLGIAGVAVSLLVGRFVLSVLYRAEYADAQPVLVWTMVASISAYAASALGYGLTAVRVFRSQVPLCAAMAAATAAACYVLVPRFGLVGAAASIAIGQFVQAAGAAWLLRVALRRSGTA